MLQLQDRLEITIDTSWKDLKDAMATLKKDLGKKAYSSGFEVPFVTLRKGVKMVYTFADPKVSFLQNELQ